MKRLLAILLSLLLTAPLPVWAAAIDHFSAAVTTAVSTSSATYAAVTGATLDSSNFTAGKKYLIFVTAQAKDTASNGLKQHRVVHGSTAFAESEQIQASASLNNDANYAWFTVWTAVAAESITLQHANGTAVNMQTDNVFMLAINLSDDLVENTDWFFNERGNDDGLSTTPTAGATVTFTPSGASNWLVLTYSQIDHTVTTSPTVSAIIRAGEASTSLPSSRIQANSADRQNIMPMARVFSLTAASNTFTEQSSNSEATANTRLHSGLFAINLNKFRNHVFEYTEADTALSATDYATQLETASITPDVQGNVWIGAYFGSDRNDSGNTTEFRVQVDGADQPTGQTTDNLHFEATNDIDDEFPLMLGTLVANMTAAAHTIDLDASSSSTTGTPAGQHTTIWAVTMELAQSAARRRTAPRILP